MSLSDNTIRYSTIMTISKAGELVKTCTYADRCLTEILSHLAEDTMLTDKQKNIVMNHAIATREVLQKSIKIFSEVVRIWDTKCASGKDPKQGGDDVG